VLVQYTRPCSPPKAPMVKASSKQARAAWNFFLVQVDEIESNLSGKMNEQ
jgi:hypothetical protein